VKWSLLPAAPEALVRELAPLPRSIVDATFHRGQDSAESTRRFLKPDYQRDTHDPFLFPAMATAVARLYTALLAKESILIHGDYDADGICATAILASLLRTLGGKVYSFLPTRQLDGYGVSMRAVEQAVKSNVRLLITADCGIAAHEALEYARAAGIDVIIVDHHRIPPELPNALAILHPQALKGYPDQTLTGGAVALKLAQGMIRSTVADHHAYRERYTPSMGWEAFEKWLLDLAAISTIADCAALTGESRMIVSFGLMVLSKTLRPGLKALYENARILDRPITEETIKFAIAPRINATGRLRDPKLSLALLLAQDVLRSRSLAIEVEEMNVLRQQLTQSALKEITAEVGEDPPSLVLMYRPDWHIGLISLFASRITHQFSRPSFVLCRRNGEITGSTRGIGEFNCVDFLERVRPLLQRFGGHKHAAGFTLLPEKLDSFCSFVREQSVRSDKPVEQELTVDGQLSLVDITPELVATLGQFSPFGIGNVEPVFSSTNVRLVGARKVGKGGTHLQATVFDPETRAQVRAVGFGMGNRTDSMLGKSVDIAYHLRLDSWNGQERIQAILRDIRIPEA
jgi:single-stranded-DNA-specific exonuclease